VKNNSYTNIIFPNEHKTRTQAFVHVKAKKKKKSKCQFAKDSSAEVNFACLYNSVKRLFPFICSQSAYADLFFTSACDRGRNPFLSRLFCIMRECGYNDEWNESFG